MIIFKNLVEIFTLMVSMSKLDRKVANTSVLHCDIRREFKIPATNNRKNEASPPAAPPKPVEVKPDTNVNGNPTTNRQISNSC
jgi:hypothetical protein